MSNTNTNTNIMSSEPAISAWNTTPVKYPSTSAISHPLAPRKKQVRDSDFPPIGNTQLNKFETRKLFDSPPTTFTPNDRPRRNYNRNYVPRTASENEAIQRGRDTVFSRMKDPVFINEHRKMTRACRNLQQRGKCTYPKCTFSHSSDEHRESICIYDIDIVDADGNEIKSKCMKIRGGRPDRDGNIGAPCPHFHPNQETIDEFRYRTGSTPPFFPTKEECDVLQKEWTVESKARKQLPKVPKFNAPKVVSFGIEEPLMEPATTEDVVYVTEDKFMETVQSAAAAGQSLNIQIKKE